MKVFITERINDVISQYSYRTAKEAINLAKSLEGNDYSEVRSTDPRHSVLRNGNHTVSFFIA